MDRREFLRRAAGLALAAAGLGFPARFAEGETPASTLAVSRGGTPEGMVAAAVGALGGMGKFVSRGDVVVVKPNIGWNREPHLAATTHPGVVRAVVRLCLEAGAGKVRVMDRPCDDPGNDAESCYRSSGIREAVESLGDPRAAVEFMDAGRFAPRPLAAQAPFPEWPLSLDVLEADRRINVPVAKHHNAARLAMALKNVMGCAGGNRGNLHRDLDRNIAALNTAVKFDLIVMDAVRVLTGNGPRGGKERDVRRMDTVVAGTDPVAADSFGATLFGITGADVPHVVESHRAGLGEIDLSRVRVLSA